MDPEEPPEPLPRGAALVEPLPEEPPEDLGGETRLGGVRVGGRDVAFGGAELPGLGLALGGVRVGGRCVAFGGAELLGLGLALGGVRVGGRCVLGGVELLGLGLALGGELRPGDGAAELPPDPCRTFLGSAMRR